SLPSAAACPTAISRYSWWLFGAAVLAKLILVSHEEISPHWVDDSGFAQSAARLYWLAPYSQYGYVRQPIYPLYLAATTLLGIPARLASELLWIGACAILVRASRACGMRPLPALVGGVLCLLLPATLTQFD